jgi:hypothetical protein
MKLAHALILCIFFKQRKVRNLHAHVLMIHILHFIVITKRSRRADESKDGEAAAVSINISLSRGSLLTNSAQEMLYT